MWVDRKKWSNRGLGLLGAAVFIAEAAGLAMLFSSNDPKVRYAVLIAMGVFGGAGFLALMRIARHLEQPGADQPQ